MRPVALLCACLLAAVLAGPAAAKVSLTEVRSYQSALAKDLERGRFAKIPESVKEDLARRNAELTQLAKAGSEDELARQFKALERAVKEAELEIVTCKREVKVGTNMRTRVCRSNRERIASTRQGRDGMIDLMKRGATNAADTD